MKLELPFGSALVSLEGDIFHNAAVFSPKSISGSAPLTIASTISIPPISKNDSIVILVDGTYIYDPFVNLLSTFESHLLSKAINNDQTHIIVTNRPGYELLAQQAFKRFEEIYGRDHVTLHSLFDSDTVAIGRTSTFSTPLNLNKQFVEADYRIAMSAIRPDVLTGATGGCMSILPGISGIETAQRHYKLIPRDGNVFKTNTPPCIDMSEACTLAGLNQILDIVPDYNSNIADLVTGNPYDTWLRGVSLANKLATREIERRYDVTVVSVGGAPYDSSLYTSLDSLKVASELTRLNGSIILIAECPKEFGLDGFENALSKFKSEKDLSFAMSHDFWIGMEKARLFLELQESYNITIVSSSLKALEKEFLDITVVESTDEIPSLIKYTHGHSGKIAVITHGNWTNSVLLN